MALSTTIANLALGHCGVGKTIGNLETEQSQEARTVRRFYEVALRSVLRRAPWPFATVITALSLVEEEPNTEWGYSYQYPSDCVMFRRVLSGLRNDTRQSQAPYRLIKSTTGKLVLTDEEDAEAEYTAYVEDDSVYPPDFELAFSYYLAMLVAPELSSGDQFKLGERAAKLFEYHLGEAVAQAFNEEQAEQLPEAEHIRARE